MLHEDLFLKLFPYAEYIVENHYNWGKAAEIFLEKGYHKEAGDLWNEYWVTSYGKLLFWPEVKNFPKDAFKFYVEKFILKLKEVESKERGISELYVEFFIFEGNIRQSITTPSEHRYPFGHKFDKSSYKNIRQQCEQKGGIEFVNKMGLLFLSQANNSDGYISHEYFLRILKVLVYTLIADEEYEKVEKIFDKYLKGDEFELGSLKKETLWSALTFEYIEQEKFGKAKKLSEDLLKSYDWSWMQEYYNEGVIEEEKKEAKLFHIKILVLNKSYNEAEKEYREIDELKLAADMYERAGMPEKAAEIYASMTGDNNVPPQQTIKVSRCPNPNCGEEIKPHWNKCPVCGTELKKNRCDCGEELKSHWNQCPACGKKLK